MLLLLSAAVCCCAAAVCCCAAVIWAAGHIFFFPLDSSNNKVSKPSNFRASTEFDSHVYSFSFQLLELEYSVPNSLSWHTFTSSLVVILYNTTHEPLIYAN